MIIKNALIYTPRHTFEEGSLTIREGRIVPFAQPEEGEEIVDAKGAYALPGLVDIHFHGAMGKDFCDGNEEAIQTLADFEAGKGVLAICPATMTFSEEILNGVMDAAAAHQRLSHKREQLPKEEQTKPHRRPAVRAWGREGAVERWICMVFVFLRGL